MYQSLDEIKELVSKCFIVVNINFFEDVGLIFVSWSVVCLFQVALLNRAPSRIAFPEATVAKIAGRFSNGNKAYGVTGDSNVEKNRSSNVLFVITGRSTSSIYLNTFRTGTRDKSPHVSKLLFKTWFEFFLCSTHSRLFKSLWSQR